MIGQLTFGGFIGFAPSCSNLGSRAFFVPGRIECLGKHTDYAGGRSLICAVELGFDSPDWLANAPRLQALHGPEFDALVDQARENAAGE